MRSDLWQFKIIVGVWVFAIGAADLTFKGEPISPGAMLFIGLLLLLEGIGERREARRKSDDDFRRGPKGPDPNPIAPQGGPDGSKSASQSLTSPEPKPAKVYPGTVPYYQGLKYRAEEVLQDPDKTQAQHAAAARVRDIAQARIKSLSAAKAPQP